MSEVSDVEIGKLIQAVKDLQRTCERLESTVEKLEEKVEEQERLITKGRTAITVLLGIAGLVWTGLELWFTK